MDLTAEQTVVETPERETPADYFRQRAAYWRERGAVWVADFMDALAADCAECMANVMQASGDNECPF